MSQGKSSSAGGAKPQPAGNINEGKTRTAGLTAEIDRVRSVGHGSPSVMNTHKPPEPIVGKKGK